MHISERDDVFTAQHVTGPTHNMLRLKIGSGTPQDFAVTVLPPIGECHHGDGLTVEEVVSEIKAGLSEANEVLGTDYTIEAAAIIENDTRQRGIFKYLTRKIVEKAAA